MQFKIKTPIFAIPNKTVTLIFNMLITMTNFNVKTIQKCLDDYMSKRGKTEIGDIEANQALAVAGVINDDQAHPGRPLREILRHLRNSNLLPQNVKQLQGLWTIKHSKTMAKVLQIMQF